MYLPQKTRGSKRNVNSARTLNTVSVGLPYGLVGASVQGSEKGQRQGVLHDQPYQTLYDPSRTRAQTPTAKDGRTRPHSSDKYFGPSSQDVLSYPDGLPPAPKKIHSLWSSSHSTKPFSRSTLPYQNINSSPGQQENFVGDGVATMSIFDPGEVINTKQRKTQSEEQHLLPSNAQQGSHVFLPGDRVIFTESPSAPGIPIAYRIAEEKQANPDKLNLDRRDLTICPVLEGEENLRLLNYQHNLIQRIQHVSNLRKLIFLDLYDNKIHEISGLASLKSLRVLMLGKNRIKKINNLTELSKLDVLDLHGNKITKIENLAHLSELRVLNLAGNELVSVQNITGLHSLAELNLRRNKICTVMEINHLPCLQRIFLSYNEIKRFDDIKSLAGSTSLSEVSLDGNPFSLTNHYKQTIIVNIKSIRQLDMKRISDEERRIAIVMAKREEDKKKESDKAATLKERRRLAITNAQRQWNLQHGENAMCSKFPGENESGAFVRTTSHSSLQSDGSSSKLSLDEKSYSVNYLVEADGDALSLYGPSALDSVEKNWGEKSSTASIKMIKFHYITFDEIVPYFHKLRTKFPSCQSLGFTYTDLQHFGQLNALASFHKLEALKISEEGNPITSFALWKHYAIFRLSHLSLQWINDTQISTEDIVHAEKLFGSLGHITMSQLSQARLMILLGNKRNIEGSQDSTEKIATKKNEQKDNRLPSGEPVSRAGLTYQPTLDFIGDKDVERRKFSRNYNHELMQMAALSDRKRFSLEKMWPKIFYDLVSKATQDMSDLNNFMKESLEKLETN